ncbi:carboxymuconolactone decarboxylase family protein [Sphingomonas sp. MG17]|uniref:Carboxymuconolactone decarboxylase family protein n=1 Tax=Sphingomonas tagetis TaxID=2949092 RepID=A0A9X2HSB9_9SPHN|nr:carboxymuconolactone decarboxylase family protein [Sphingomonas tagetis]MCP3732603.1 carboxymuconolactone decarboxylase family protein [Sphingomonas tagetis]
MALWRVPCPVPGAAYGRCAFLHLRFIGHYAHNQMILARPQVGGDGLPVKSVETVPVKVSDMAGQVSRLPLVKREDAAELFELLDERRGPSANANIFALMANCPDILRPFLDMADAVRRASGLDPRLRELSILIVCLSLGNRYEFGRHWNLARRLGVTRQTLLDLWDFEESDKFDALEKAAMRLARDATRAPEQVDPLIWDPVHESLGDQQALALLFTIGWYNMSARITGPAKLQLEPDLERL